MKLVCYFEPLPEISSELIIQNFHSLVYFIDLPDFGHDVVNESLVLVALCVLFLLILLCSSYFIWVVFGASFLFRCIQKLIIIVVARSTTDITFMALEGLQ